MIDMLKLRNPEDWLKRKTERLKRRKRPVLQPKHLSVKKYVMMNDGSTANIPVSDLLRIARRFNLMKQVQKYPKAFKRFHRKVNP